MLYTTPTIHISDIITTTNIVDDRGRIFYQVIANNTNADNSADELSVKIHIRNRDGDIVATTKSAPNDLKGYIEIDNVMPWWPYLMHPEPGYLYTMEVKKLVKNVTLKINLIQFRVGISFVERRGEHRCVSP